jgi:3-phosphoshikimate 1-carboxyvinyltransferase
MHLTLSHPTGKLSGSLSLAGSKSISNRVLIIRALCGTDFPIDRLANAKDTQLLESLLQHDGQLRDAGAAGTTYRFMTAYLSMLPGTQVLTGTERMKERPIGVLVEALRAIGADIEYLEKPGFPPLRIGPPHNLGASAALSISAGTSSQYISALLMIAPVLPGGLTLYLDGKIVSRPYIEMTLRLMEYFGVRHTWQDRAIHVPPQTYQARPFTVEADWSAASYYYAMAALSQSADLFLEGLFANSLQGDAILPDLYEPLGVYTRFAENGIWITKAGERKAKSFDYDFLRCPDLAQTLAVTCAGMGMPGAFRGVETLRIKETDRIEALRQELGKMEVAVRAFDDEKGGGFTVDGLAAWDEPPVIHTYEDHRMAMAFAPLALLGALRVADPEVVVKSYPDFWEDLKKLGFRLDI